MATCTSSSIDPLSKSNIGLVSSHTCQCDGYFAFARINGEIYLVQGTYKFVSSFFKFNSYNPFAPVSCATPASALATVDVKIFRHEFITVFRLSESKTFHPADICIVEPIDDRLTRYEEENGTVFLARDLVARMRMMANPPPRLMGQSRRNQLRQR